VPDPQAEATFLRSKLRWEERDTGEHAGVLRLYRDLLDLRRLPALRSRSRDSFGLVALGEAALALRRNGPAAGEAALVLVNLRGRLELELGARPETIAPGGCAWSTRLSTEDERYGGRGGPQVQGNSVVFEGPAAVVLTCG
jgi:maltooligosyltrehalose trehalohydrolase